MTTIWKPNTTVAAVIEQNGKFLLVEEHTKQGIRFNQPAGHLEPNESLIDAAIREVQEETAWQFQATDLVGIYRWHSEFANTTYLRFAFCGSVSNHNPNQTLDDGIIRAVWLTLDEIRANQAQHRSPLILRCIEDYLSNKRYPLELLVHYD